MEISFNVSPTLHPKTVESIPGYQQHSGYLSSVHDAFGTAYQELEAIHKARQSARKNPTLNEAARTIKVADFAAKKQDAITKKFDAAMRHLSDAIKHTEESLTNPLVTGAAHPALNAEIRAHVKALPRGERITFIREAQEKGDVKTLTAVLGAPAYLSGITEVEQAAYTRRYHESRNPEAAARLEAMQAGMKLLEQAAGLVFKEVEKAIGADWGKVQRLKQARDEAERAFNV